MNYKPYLIILMFFAGILNAAQKEDSLSHSAEHFYRFVFITASYNNAHRYKSNIDSMVKQNYPHWCYRIIYIDDNSSDGNGELVQSYIKKINKVNMITLIKNSVRRGQLANIYDAIHQCDDDEIVIIVDGDDKLPHYGILTYLNKIYHYHDVWMTYGQFKFVCENTQNPKHNKLGWAAAFPQNIINNRSYRSYRRYVLTHLRTFFAWLGKQVKLKDLLHKNYFYLSATDAAFMFPLIEMAGSKFKFINEHLYDYLYHPATKLHFNLAQEIRAKDKYPIIAKKIISSKRPISFSGIFLMRDLSSYGAFEKIQKALAHNYNATYCPSKSINRHNKGSVIFFNTFQELPSCLNKTPDEYLLFLANPDHANPKHIINCLTYMKSSFAEIAILHTKNIINSSREVHTNIFALDCMTAKKIIRDASVIIEKKYLLAHPQILAYWDKKSCNLDFLTNGGDNILYLYSQLT